MTKEQAIAELKAKGQDQLAEMLSAMDVTPGKGRLQRLAAYTFILLTVYLLAAFFQWLQQYTIAGVAPEYCIPTAAGHRYQTCPVTFKILRQPSSAIS